MRYRGTRKQIYFLEWPEMGLIKIGCTEYLPQRLSQIRSTGWLASRFLAIMPGSLKRERLLHERFAEYRVWGEWYHGADEIRAFAASRGIKRISLDRYGKAHIKRRNFFRNALGLECVKTYRRVG